jgi:hypothetical protein
MPYISVIGLALATQFLLLSVTFPLSELWTAKPLLFSDGGYHWYQITVATNLARDGMVIGYDPFFAAGYPDGVNYNGSAKLPAAVTIVLQHWLSAEVVYKLYVFVSGLIAPVCVALTARWLNLSWRTAAVAVVFGLFLWWASVFRWYFSHGMVSFVTVAYLALPYSVYAIRWLRGESGWWGLVGLGATGGLGMFWHPLFPLIVTFATVGYLMVCWRQLALGRMVLLGTVVPALSLLLNLFWFVPQYLLITERFSKMGDKSPYQTIVDVNLIWQELLGTWSGHAHGSKVYTLLGFTVLWACFGARSRDGLVLSRAFSVGGLLLIVFAAVGSAIPGAGALEANRFAPVGYLLLCIPAAIGVSAMVAAARVAPWGAQRTLATGSLVVVLLGSAYAVNEILREVSYQDIGHYGKVPPQVNGVGEYSQWVLNWLKTETDDSGRVLFETSLGRIYDGSRMAGYYAYTTRREFIGGPYPFQHFASFWDGTIVSRRLEDLPQAQFTDYVDLYNLRWIIVHSDASKRYLDEMPGVIPTGEFKQLKAYRIDQAASYFMAGNGTIKSRDHNKLVVSDITGDPVILKYHFVRGLQAEPFASIVPVYLLDDPNPFIKIIHPPREFVLRMP